MIQIQRESNKHPDLRELVRLLDEDLLLRYGDKQALYNGLNRLNTINHVVLAYVERVPVGCGCLRKFGTDSVEIKRMFVKQAFRGSGIAGMILRELENWAKELGFKRLVLETGIKQPEAIRFYLKFGYEITDNYGHYVEDINSVCMKKQID